MPLFTDICGAVDQFEQTIADEISTMVTHAQFLTAADNMNSGRTDMNLQLSGTLGTYVTGLLMNRLDMVEADMRRFAAMKGLKQNIEHIHEVLREHAKVTAAIIRGGLKCTNSGNHACEERYYKDTIYKQYGR